MAVKVNWKLLAVCVGIPLAVGVLAGLLTRSGMENFQMVTQPPLSPPAWVFPVVWTILYVLMGIGSYLVLVSGGDAREKRRAMTAYAVQLGMNFLWPLFFFGLGWYLFSLFWLAGMWIAVLVTMVRFYRIENRAGDLLLPYLLWLTFAGHLNFGVYLLNR